jgi:hypothetical protein
MRSIITILLVLAALLAGARQHADVYAAGAAPAGRAPAAAQIAPAGTAPSPTPRRRDEPPPPSVIERTQPTLRLAGLVGISTVLAILVGSLLIHRRHQARASQQR